MPRYYLTTPIYYPNAEPHIGHAYTTIAADAIARYHRLCGDDTFFLTGTDEHGIKMVKTAIDQKMEPAALADSVVKVFEQVWKELDITHDDFIRTTQPRHKQGVQKIVQQLVDKGDIYLGGYEGWYDEGQEEFVPENTAKEQQYKSAISGRPLVRYKEPSYFFRLTKYAGRVLEYIKAHPEFVQPATRRNEVISKLEAGVDDLSISRATLKWGIPMPNDPQHVVYVWIDALSNYITALGYGSDDDSNFKKYWPADLHLIGKEILWFHAVYWPAMLFALELPLPKMLFAHGWWTADGMKMGKTTGNFVGIDKLRELGRLYGLDSVRYYLLRAAAFGADLDWTGRKQGTDDDFHKAFNELANVVGNCLNRDLNMAGKYRGQLPPLGELEDIDRNLIDQTKRLAGELAAAYAKCELQQCALLPIELARTTNGYIDATAPFKLAKDPAKASRLDTVLHVASQAIYAALVGLLPILPEKAAAGLKQLGANIEGKTLGELLAAGLPVGHPIAPGQPLFPKVETPKS
ncbi:MAG TPA: methionine--tRNA ligase [Tepidisphaeraceae bacterium]|jgi:methionyl-tRNA synthetase|nr:methionine--tRNA ligase [Tepidisphaeraceae bacterium]